MGEFEKFLSFITEENFESVKKNFKPEFLEMKNKNGELPVHTVSRNGNIDIMKFLTIGNGKSYINARNNYENTPLHLACQYGHDGVVDLLCEMKCEINAINSNGDRPIHLACRNGKLTIVEFLVKDGDINATNLINYSPMHFACQYGHFQIAKLLYKNKCDIELENNDGNRPIHIASNNNHIEIVKYLCRKKCDIEAKNNQGKLPIDLAIQNNHKQVKICINVERRLRKINGIDSDTMLKFDSPENEEALYIIITSTDFIETEVIGVGTFGNVYRYSDSITKFKLAIKLINEFTENINSLENHINEFKVKMINPRIVRYYGSKREKDKMYIFMEYMEKGSLSDVIKNEKNLSKLKIKKYSQHILEGIEFLHNIKIIHRDIKPRNILIDADDNIKLCDFGISCLLNSNDNENSENMSFCGTVCYMAPEVICKERYGLPADIWSFGATLVEMLSGSPPYSNLNPIAVIFKIGQKKVVELTPTEPISNDMEYMINNMIFVPDQTKRATAKELLKFIKTHEI